MKWLKSAALAIAVIGVTIAGAAVVEKIGILATADQTVKLGDNVELWLGSGANEQDPSVGDVQARWDGTDLDVLPTADDSVFKLGNGTLSFDAWLYGNTASDYLLWDASSSLLSVKGAAVLTAGQDIIQICGDLTTVNNNTVYYGPNRAVVATTASGMTCDVAATGNVTEATADAPALEAQAFQVSGMTCRTVDMGATVSFTLRSAAAATTPSVTCSVADNELDCVADIQTTTAVASGATLAVAAASTGNLGTGAFVCNIAISY